MSYLKFGELTGHGVSFERYHGDRSAHYLLITRNANVTKEIEKEKERETELEKDGERD